MFSWFFITFLHPGLRTMIFLAKMGVPIDRRLQPAALRSREDGRWARPLPGETTRLPSSILAFTGMLHSLGGEVSAEQRVCAQAAEQSNVKRRLEARCA